MTTPTDDETVGRALREMLGAGATPPAPVTAAQLRARAEHRRLRRMDAKVVVALVAVAAVVVALIVVGPLRSTSGPTPAPAATRPTSTSTSRAVTTTTVAAGRTRVTAFDPFTPDGVVNPALHVTSTLVATTCEAAGVAGNSSYRCFSGNGIYDPCFSRSSGNAGPLVCTTDPASADVVELTWTSALPTPLQGAPDQRPWAVQLDDGQVCVLVNAAWGDLGPFGCQTSVTPGPAADCHTPVEGADGWTADCQEAETETSAFTPTTVDIVWK